VVGVVFVAGAAFMPRFFDGAMLSAGLVGALVGAGVRGRGAARRAGRGLLGAGLLAALAGFAVLALGVAALGWAAEVGLRPHDGSADYYANVYLTGMGAALGAVIILATALAAGLAVVAAGHPLRKPVPAPTLSAATMGLVLFLALSGLPSGAFIFYLSCTVGLLGGDWMLGGPERARS